MNAVTKTKVIKIPFVDTNRNNEELIMTMEPVVGFSFIIIDEDEFDLDLDVDREEQSRFAERFAFDIGWFRTHQA